MSADTNNNENGEPTNYVKEYERTYSALGHTTHDSDGNKRYGIHYDGKTGTLTFAEVDIEELPDKRRYRGPRGETISFEPGDEGVETHDIDEVTANIAEGTLLTTRQTKQYVLCELGGMKKRDVIRIVFDVTMDEAHEIALQASTLQRKAAKTDRALSTLAE